MLIFDTIHKTLEIKVFVPVTTNELQFTCSYVDITATTFLPIESDGQIGRAHV